MSTPNYSEFVKTEDGQILYRKWSRIRKNCCPEWANSFGAFIEWSLNNFFEAGASLLRFNRLEGYSPENCYWSIGDTTHSSYRASGFCAAWNKTVNRIREYYGMPLFIVEEEDNNSKTCKDCVHYNVCKYKAEGVPVCDDYLD